MNLTIDNMPARLLELGVVLVTIRARIRYRRMPMAVDGLAEELLVLLAVSFTRRLQSRPSIVVIRVAPRVG